MNGAVILRAGFGVARAERHVECPADLFVEENVAGEAVNIGIGADGKFSQITRTCIGLDHLKQVILILLGLCGFDSSAIERQFRAFDSHAAINRRIGELDPAIDRVLPPVR